MAVHCAFLQKRLPLDKQRLQHFSLLGMLGRVFNARLESRVLLFSDGDRSVQHGTLGRWQFWLRTKACQGVFLDSRFEQVADNLAPCGKFRVCQARQPESLDAMLAATKRADEPVCETERISDGSPLSMHAMKFGCVNVTAIGPTMLETDWHLWQGFRRACFQGNEGRRLGDCPN